MTDSPAEAVADEDPCVCGERAPAGQYYRCPICDAEWPEDDPDEPTPVQEA